MWRWSIGRSAKYQFWDINAPFSTCLNQTTWSHNYCFVNHRLGIWTLSLKDSNQSKLQSYDKDKSKAELLTRSGQVYTEHLVSPNPELFFFFFIRRAWLHINTFMEQRRRSTFCTMFPAGSKDVELRRIFPILTPFKSHSNFPPGKAYWTMLKAFVAFYL